ncbi:MAG: acetolactate synthase small subunit [Ignavibacteriales bacterium]|nr:MAG: acetolactate synthase 3 regulatory subunit [Stygiobacter sp.]KAF0214686.1 MAG: acetolactate synthase 3 regulatory [Ignavibacteria bacterium]MBI3122964.1 acetolactate synthase small subunit [Ignavibacteriales bacterium]OGU67224.1 MAG: acetolactate synthase small subunit [Stygiobacter sp. GWC2_38_9]OGU82172.1 MAG: acetolactate synthase small subunit [Stygiobacter sp. RIFOXYA12_FULL_38_9]OGV08917.1 MAG: acetolactate synthase small subunit [Stygiobacter sp. RIFOXYB2_FULL_37_11]OGV15584.1 
MKHTISVLVENHFGAFDRVATMFSGKGFNIRSISIGETEIEEISRMTIVTEGDDQIIDQVVKQLNRLIDTIKVVDLSDAPRVERELALIKVSVPKGAMEEIKNINDIFRGNIVDITNKSLTIEVTGPPDKIDAAINLLSAFGIKEIARSGIVALKRGEQVRILKEKNITT